MVPLNGIAPHFLKLKESGVPGPHLVVAPKTLMDNWISEIKNFSGNTLKIFLCDAIQRFNPGSINMSDVVLTTYDTLRINQASFGTIDWNMVVCDEAQYAKNPTTQRTTALKALKSKHRAALTGTPVENGLIEFWCIMDFVQPGLLGSWTDFRKNYERPIIEDDEEKRENKINELLENIRGHYLRRLKDDVIDDLPKKSVTVMETSLSDKQFEFYKEIAGEAKSGGRGKMLAAIGKLLRLCACPEENGQVLGLSHCPKMADTLELLKQIREKDEKVLIFSDFKLLRL